MKTPFCHALQDIRNVDDVPVSESFDQANMIQEVLEGLRNIVCNQVAEALSNTISPQSLTSYDLPPSNQGGSNFYYPPYQQANAINLMQYDYTNVTISLYDLIYVEVHLISCIAIR